MILQQGKFKGRETDTMTTAELGEAAMEEAQLNAEYAEFMKQLHLRNFERLIRIEEKLDQLLSR